MTELARLHGSRGGRSLDGFRLAQVNYSVLQPGVVKAFHVHGQSNGRVVRPTRGSIARWCWSTFATGRRPRDDTMRFVLGDGVARLVRDPTRRGSRLPQSGHRAGPNRVLHRSAFLVGSRRLRRGSPALGPGGQTGLGRCVGVSGSMPCDQASDPDPRTTRPAASSSTGTVCRWVAPTPTTSATRRTPACRASTWIWRGTATAGPSTDLGSKNGTMLNGSRITGKQRLQFG